VRHDADAADANDDGAVDVSDQLAVLNTLFGNGPSTAGLGACGVDVTPDGLGSCEQEGCGAP
jgi:hypothetical protein